MSKITPFPYIDGPKYVYVIQGWRDTTLVPIYVGRGTGRRAKTYYQLRRNYFNPKTHNIQLNERIAAIRRDGLDVCIVAFDCGGDKAHAQAEEKCLISRYGRVAKGTGTLFNRNGGG